MTEIKNTATDHLGTFNQIFKIKSQTTCMECGNQEELKESKLNHYDNHWNICKECEEEIDLKLQGFNNDVEAGINYNLSNNY